MSIQSNYSLDKYRVSFQRLYTQCPDNVSTQTGSLIVISYSGIHGQRALEIIQQYQDSRFRNFEVYHAHQQFAYYPIREYVLNLDEGFYDGIQPYTEAMPFEKAHLELLRRINDAAKGFLIPLHVKC